MLNFGDRTVPVFASSKAKVFRFESLKIGRSDQELSLCDRNGRIPKRIRTEIESVRNA
jgi:hypothetical protein